MPDFDRAVDNIEMHKKVRNALKNIKLANGRDTSKLNITPVKGETFELQFFDNGSSLVYTNEKGLLIRVIDIDLEGRILRERLLEKGTLVEVRGFDKEGDMDQLAIWNCGIMWKKYDIRKDKTIESQAKFIEIQDVENCIAVYETMVFDESGNCIEPCYEAKKIAYSEDMNVWMLESC